MLRRVILSAALSCFAWGQDQPGMWTFSNRPYFDPLHADPRAAQTQVLFPAVSTGFPFAVKSGRHMAWDVNLGKEFPILGWETRRIEDVDGVGPGQFGIGVWFPLSFHIVEDMGKDPSNPILNTDYRFGGMVKGQFGLWGRRARRSVPPRASASTSVTKARTSATSLRWARCANTRTFFA